jgi:hypothetical protein
MRAIRVLLFTALLALVLVPLVLVLAIPPWQSRLPWIVQNKLGRWTGIYLHHFPADFSGTFRMWDDRGNLVSEDEYKHGLRDGKWIAYDPSGRTNNICEYRNGKPWNGVCQVYDQKAWLGEYKQGHPWNGCLPVEDEKKGTTEWRFFVDGKEVTQSDYKMLNHIPENAQCVGLQYMKMP